MEMEQNKDASDNINTEFSEPSTSVVKVVRPRTAKLKALQNSETVQPVDPHEWTEAEKMKLAIALQKYGHLDADKLHEDVPTKTIAQIKSYTYWVIKKSRLWFNHDVSPGTDVPKKGRRMFSKAPIDQWLCAFEQCQTNVRDEFRDCLAKTLLYISRYEPHPDPEDCDGVDYAAMYEFLYFAVNGYPVKAVTPPTASAILKALEELSNSVASAGNEREKEHLNKVKRLVFVENATKRHYGKKVKNKESGPVENLLDVKGFNPLNIPYALLERKKKQP